MSKIRTLRHQTIVVAALLSALMVAALWSVWASAAIVTDRSIVLSSSSTSATNVTYGVNFTADGTAGAFVVDFCANSPIIGQVCTPPPNFNASTATSTSSGFTDVTAIDSSTVVVTGAITANSQVSVELDGITNPSDAGALYARIVTYDDEQAALNYESEDLGTGNVDDGSVAISITSTIGVTGSVLESMTFCVSGAAINENCVGAQASAPTLTLGETVGDVVALSADDVSEGAIHTQISTNAASGAVIRLKSSAIGCGGLVRAGAPESCDIGPALTGGIAAGQALFGLKTADATDTGDTASGALLPVQGSGYNNATFALNFAEGDGSGVTSTLGDPFLDTAGAPVNNKNMALTFGASASNDTPAGTYSVDLSLIATGRF